MNLPASRDQAGARDQTWSRERPRNTLGTEPATDVQQVQPTLSVQLKMLDDGLEPPAYAHPGDAGADLRTRIDCRLAPGDRILVPTGVSLALPHGFVALIHPRSGLATKHGLTIVNAPGT